MSVHRRNVALTVLAALVIPALGWWALFAMGLVGPPGKPVRPPFNMSDRIATIEIVESDEGSPLAVFETKQGQKYVMTGEQFLREVQERKASLPDFLKMPGLFELMDVTSVTSLLWIAFGLLAQGIFAGRMIVQWWASEKVGYSTVPNLFWWMSLVGSSMCIIYFIWRKEIVGILGQSTGWLVYVRNLWMIYGNSNSQSSGEK